MRPPRDFRKFDYERERLPNKYLQSFESDVRNIDEAKEITGHSIGYPGWCIIYYLLLSHLNPKRFNNILETGTNWGCTTIVLAQALRDSSCDGRVHSIEIDAANVCRAVENLKAAHVDELVAVHLGSSLDVLPEVLQDIDHVNLAFLDASHLHDDVVSEFEIILPKLFPDSLVLFDNTYQIAEKSEDPRVNGALKTIMSEHGGNLVNLRFVSWYTPGLAIWQKTPPL